MLKRFLLLLLLSFFFVTPARSATVIGSFDGLVEDTHFDAIWVFENDDITIILDPLSA